MGPAKFEAGRAGIYNMSDANRELGEVTASPRFDSVLAAERARAMLRLRSACERAPNVTTSDAGEPAGMKKELAPMGDSARSGGTLRRAHPSYAGPVCVMADDAGEPVGMMKRMADAGP